MLCDRYNICVLHYFNDIHSSVHLPNPLTHKTFNNAPQNTDNPTYGTLTSRCRYEATRQIRQWEQEQGKKRIPIIALTASVTKDEAQQCFDAGMDAHCIKPINVQVMIRLIDEWYKKSRTAT